jgi:hypothetical protein
MYNHLVKSFKVYRIDDLSNCGKSIFLGVNKMVDPIN